MHSSLAGSYFAAAVVSCIVHQLGLALLQQLALYSSLAAGSYFAPAVVSCIVHQVGLTLLQQLALYSSLAGSYFAPVVGPV